MCWFRTMRPKSPVTEFFAAGLFAAAALIVCPTLASAHQLWIETKSSAKVGKEHDIHVCWGHSGHRETGAMLAGQQDKLSAYVLSPTGRSTLNLTKGDDSFSATITPRTPGAHAVGAELQTGIIDQELHGIPAKTRIVMCGAAYTRVGVGRDETIGPLGFDLEIVPVSLAREPKPGELVTVRVLHKGKPIGGRNVLVSAATCGLQPPPEDPRVQTLEWSIEAMADPKTGEATFPLIVGGQHVFCVKYFDETPGTYDGDRNDSSEFSHLRKGDAYERTMYVSTLTLQAGGK